MEKCSGVRLACIYQEFKKKFIAVFFVTCLYAYWCHGILVSSILYSPSQSPVVAPVTRATGQPVLAVHLGRQETDTPAGQTASQGSQRDSAHNRANIRKNCD